MGESGGVAAARGLQFQYLITLRDALDHLESASDVVVLHVEPSTTSDRPAGDPTLGEVVDYGFSGGDGRLRKVVQVKSVADPARSRPMGLPAVLRVLGRLLEQPGDAVCELVTNARLTDEAAAFVAALPGAGAGSGSALDGAGGRTTEVVEWVAAHRHRLSRCRVTAVGEDLAQLRSVTRSRLMAYRRGHGISSGAEAAGVLSSHAVMTIFDGATVPGGRRITLDDLSAELLVSAEEVARAIGRYDWGRPIGSLPGLPELARGPVVAEVDARLARPATPGPVPLVVLTGLSGMGKTSVAARYAFAHADDYDYVVWVNGESPATISSTMVLVHRELTRSTAPEGDSLAEAVRLHLAEYPGRWLLVFDNANDPRVVEPWLPAIGGGQVIVTSVNATAWSARRPVVVPPLTEEESVQLMAAQLFDPGAVVSPDARSDLARLAGRLEHWPLALALAASYLAGAGRGPGGSEEYFEQLRERVINTEDAIPPGYPRTLTTAILLACESLSDLPGGLGGVALRCLLAASYLSAESIPVDLLYLSGCVAPLEMVRSTLTAPTMLQERTEIDEVVRALRTRSLVSRAHRPTASTRGEFVADQLGVNEIVQLVLRNRIEHMAPIAYVVDIVDRVAYHVQSWLAGMRDADDLNGLLLLERHATTVNAHCDRLTASSFSIALLKGNLALAYSMRGQYGEALRLLDEELSILDLLPGSGPALRLKVHSQRTDALFNLDVPVPALLHESARIATLLQQLEPDEITQHRDVVALTASQQLSLLSNLAHSPAIPPPLLSELVTAFEPFAQLGSGQAKVDQMELSRRLQQMVSTGDDDPALALIAETLDGAGLPSEAQLELLGLRAEIHARHARWDLALDTLRDLSAIAPPDHYGPRILTIAGNVGLPTAVSVTRGHGGRAALQVLNTAWELVVDRLAGANPFDARRARLMAATAALQDRRITDAREHLGQVRSTHAGLSHGTGSDAADEHLITVLDHELDRLERAAVACGPIPLGAPAAVKPLGYGGAILLLLVVRSLDDQFRQVVARWRDAPKPPPLGLTGRWAGSAAERYLVLDAENEAVAISWDPALFDHQTALQQLDHGTPVRLVLADRSVDGQAETLQVIEAMLRGDDARLDSLTVTPSHGVGSPRP